MASKAIYLSPYLNIGRQFTERIVYPFRALGVSVLQSMAHSCSNREKGI